MRETRLRNSILFAQDESGSGGGAAGNTRTVPRSAADSGTGDDPLHTDAENERGPVATPGTDIPVPDDVDLGPDSSDGQGGGGHSAGGPVGGMGT